MRRTFTVLITLPQMVLTFRHPFLCCSAEPLRGLDELLSRRRAVLDDITEIGHREGMILASGDPQELFGDGEILIDSFSAYVAYAEGVLFFGAAACHNLFQICGLVRR